MNILFYDPIFLQPDKMIKILAGLRITEVYSLMSHDKCLDDIYRYCGDKLVIKRKINESLDEVKRRCVYQIVGKISTPLINQGEWVGDCYVADIYKESKYDDFRGNLQLGDPNILILKSEEIQQEWGYQPKQEKTNIRIMEYVFNILKKYGTIEYWKRFCVKGLSKYITLQDEDISFFSRSDIGPVEVLGEYLRLKNPHELAEFFLTKEGVKERNAIIKENIAEEDLPRAPTDWEQLGRDEIEYIVNNGGDWILDNG